LRLIFSFVLSFASRQKKGHPQNFGLSYTLQKPVHTDHQRPIRATG